MTTTLAVRMLAVGVGLALLGAGGAYAQDSLQNGSTAVAQSGAAASSVAGGAFAGGSVVVGSAVVAAGASATAVGGSAIAAGGQLSGVAGRAGRFASGPLSVDAPVVVTPQDAPKVPYEAQAAPPKTFSPPTSRFKTPGV